MASFKDSGRTYEERVSIFIVGAVEGIQIRARPGFTPQPTGMDISATVLELLPAITAFDLTFMLAHFNKSSATGRADEAQNVASGDSVSVAIDFLHQPVKGIVIRDGNERPVWEGHKKLRADLEDAN